MNFAQSKLLDTLPKQFFANLVAKVNKKISEGVDVINLGQGNPDKPTPDYIVKSTQKWVADPQTHKYSLFRGLPAFKEHPPSLANAMAISSPETACIIAETKGTFA